MSEHAEARPGSRGAGAARHACHFVHRENLTTQQMHTIGQRRADAEEKLAHHLRQARHLAGEKYPATEEPTRH